MKKLMAFVLAFATVLSLSACGAKTEDVKANSKATNKAQITTIQETTTKTTTIATTTGPEATKADTAYWDEVCKEYDETFNTTAHSSCVVDGVAYWQVPREEKFVIHNLATKETKLLDIEDGVYCNGYIYGQRNTKNSGRKNAVACFDLQGNLIKETEEFPNSDNNDFFINKDGSIVYSYADQKYNLYVFSPNFLEKRELKLTVDMGHGKTEEAKFMTPNYAYNNNLYVSANNGTGFNEYVIDITTGESKKLDYLVPYGGNLNGYQIGKYLINVRIPAEAGIFNIETGEKISEISPQYFAGHSQIMRSYQTEEEGYIYKCIVPNNLSDFMNTSSSDCLSNYVTYAKKYGKLVYKPELKLSEDPIFPDDDHMFITDQTGNYLIDLKTGTETEIILD